MTFGEKLYQLRKESGLSQEALAEKLNTSRQAVSKWENDNGFPEIEKVISISKIFQISLDELLINDYNVKLNKELEKDKTEKKELYVSRETANGFLLFYKKRFLLIALACGIVLGSNGISYFSSDFDFEIYAQVIEPFIVSASAMIGLAIIIYIILKQNPYREFRKKLNYFDPKVRRELEVEFQKIKKGVFVGILFGILFLFVINSGIGPNIRNINEFKQIMTYIIITMLLNGISIFLLIFCSGIYWSYSSLLQKNVMDIDN